MNICKYYLGKQGKQMCAQDHSALKAHPSKAAATAAFTHCCNIDINISHPLHFAICHLPNLETK